MSQTGPPVIIPEDGLQVSPAVWQIIFIFAAPLLAGVAIALPAILLIYLTSSAILFVWNIIDPPKSSQPILYFTEDQSDANTNQNT